MRHALLLKFDGGTVLAQEFEAHPSLPDSEAVFHNFIGRSTSGPDFTGRCLSISSAGADELLADANKALKGAR